MSKLLKIMFSIVMCAILCVGLLSCVHIEFPQEHDMEDKNNDTSSLYDGSPIKVNFYHLINNPEYYKDKLIEIDCYVSSAKDYVSFQSVRISTKRNISENYERDCDIIMREQYSKWDVMPVSTWEYTDEDIRLKVGDSITIVGYFRYRKDGENPDWYDGILSEGDYGKIIAASITKNKN